MAGDIGGPAGALGASKPASAAACFFFLSLRISRKTAVAQATPMMLPARPTPSATPRSLLLLLPPPPPPLLAELEVDVADAAVTVTPVARAVPGVDVVLLLVLVVRVLELVVVVFLDVVDVDDVVEDVKATVAVLLRANWEVPSVQQPEPQQ